MMLLKRLRDESSRLGKETILRSATPIELRVFDYAYDNDKTYFLKFDDVDYDNLGEPTEAMFSLLETIRHRVVTGQAARDLVEAYARDNGDLTKLICNKDLDCGVSKTTVNKVRPGTVPVFSVQLAKEVPLEKLTFPLFAELKYDGVRIAILYDGKDVVFKTRNGKVIHLPQARQVMLEDFEANGVSGIMLDTEVTLREGGTVNRTSVSGMINSARCGTRIDESQLVFNVFDTLPLAHFYSQLCNLPYHRRRQEVEALVSKCSNSPLRLVETLEVFDVDQVNTLFRNTLAKGEEGLILKAPSHLYTFKRSKDWVKLKAIETADLQCVDTIEGTGKYEGMIGALVCEGEVEGKKVRVNVGSGLTDCDRASHVSDYIGHIIEVKYNTIIQDSVSGEWSLFLPRFVTVRFDK